MNGFLIRILHWCYLTLLLGSPLAAAELELRFTRSEGVVGTGGALVMDAPTSIIVRLGTHYFYEQDGERVEIFDFQRERWIQVVKGRKIFDAPLAAFVADRHRRLLEAGRMVRDLQDLNLHKGEDDEYPLFNLEARYGMSAGIPLAVNAVPKRLPPNGRIWMAGNSVLSEIHSGPTDIPRAFETIWSRYMAYRWPLHPRIRKQIAVAKTFPSKARLRSRSLEKIRLLHLTVDSVQLKHDSQYTNELRLQIPAKSKIPAEALWWRFMRREQLPERLTIAELDQGLQKSLGYKLYAEALLFAIEANLQEGSAIEGALKALEPALELDPTLLQILRGMDTVNAPAAAAAVDALETLSPRSFARGHVLHALRGDAHAAAGNDREAEKAYLSALQANPYLTAVYANLGSLYASSGRTREAYSCWELARRCRSDHPTLSPLRKLDITLRKEHRDFFWPTN